MEPAIVSVVLMTVQLMDAIVVPSSRGENGGKLGGDNGCTNGLFAGETGGAAGGHERRQQLRTHKRRAPL